MARGTFARSPPLSPSPAHRRHVLLARSLWGGLLGRAAQHARARTPCRPCPSPLTPALSALSPPQGVIWFRLEKGPLHFVDGQYFKLHQLETDSPPRPL